jgi:hypothetical protein
LQAFATQFIFLLRKQLGVLWPLQEIKPKSRWSWISGLMATGVAGAAVILLRGCWHGKMSWPVRAQDYTYQVCLGCGIKRLFDEQSFRAYGPYSYDLNRLITWARSQPSTVPAEISASRERSA